MRSVRASRPNRVVRFLGLFSSMPISLAARPRPDSRRKLAPFLLLYAVVRQAGTEPGGSALHRRGILLKGPDAGQDAAERSPATPGPAEGVLECRIDWGPAYRVYFGRDGDVLAFC